MDLDWPPFDEGGSSCFDASSLQDSTTSIIASDSRIRGDLGWRLWGNNIAMDWYKGSSGPKFGSDWSFKIQLPHICHLRSPHMPESKKIILEVLWSSVLPKGSPYHVWVMVLSIQGVGSVRPNYLRLDNLLQSTPPSSSLVYEGAFFTSTWLSGAWKPSSWAKHALSPQPPRSSNHESPGLLRCHCTIWFSLLTNLSASVPHCSDIFQNQQLPDLPSIGTGWRKVALSVLLYSKFSNSKWRLYCKDS